MSRSARLWLFSASVAGLGALLLWGVAGLPAFGESQSAYGRLLNAVAPQERHVTNVVTSIVFDYRGIDTLGEEFILFGSVIGVALLLRGGRTRAQPQVPARGEAVRLTGGAAAALLLVLGLSVVAHGILTPGGGFQGGVVLASAFAVVFLAGEYRAYRRLVPVPAVDFVEGTGAGGYAVIGVVSLLLGSAYLHNFAPLGTTGTLASGGSITLLNLASALEVGAAFVLIFTEFAEELVETSAIGRS